MSEPSMIDNVAAVAPREPEEPVTWRPIAPLVIGAVTFGALAVLLAVLAVHESLYNAAWEGFPPVDNGSQFGDPNLGPGLGFASFVLWIAGAVQLGRAARFVALSWDRRVLPALRTDQTPAVDGGAS